MSIEIIANQFAIFVFKIDLKNYIRKLLKLN